ncbi:MAG: hypothetical protein CBB71_10745 [Rhodopirellula sp. TMED11]|nr:MAG: hypothetical protein CBB71_10745 [Rhodopirellula sp. TMED11]
MLGMVLENASAIDPQLSSANKIEQRCRVDFVAIAFTPVKDPWVHTHGVDAEVLSRMSIN